MVRCFLHEPDPGEVCDYPVSLPNVEWVRLPIRSSGPHRLLPGGGLCRRIRRQSRDLNAFLIRGPTSLLPRLASAVRPLPVALLLVGDRLAGSAGAGQPFWRRPLVKLFGKLYNIAQTRAATRALTFVNSRPLLMKYSGVLPDLIETRTTTLSARDFFHREDTCEGRPIRLLYAGRYAAEKGLLNLVAALRLLVTSGLDVHLEMAGWEQPGSDAMRRVRGAVSAGGLTERFMDHGARRLGPELWTVYRGADVFVLASRSDFEGFPRALWEAMAHSLPVVATAVGGIPGVLRDGVHAVLVQPRDPTALARGIRQVVEDGELRRRMIAGGRKLAESNTLEQLTGELVAAIERFVAERRSAGPADGQLPGTQDPGGCTTGGG